jgi:hypothetical protein
VLVHMWNLEHNENGDEHGGLDGFRPPESKTLHLVCGGIMRGREVPSNGALRCLIWSTG